jgi:hypothetical protein
VFSFVVQHLFKPGSGTVVDALYDVNEAMIAARVTGQRPKVDVDFPRRFNFGLAPLLEQAPQVGSWEAMPLEESPY